MYDDEDENQAPAWLSWSWALSQEIENALNKGFVVRIATKKPTNKPVIDRLIWSEGGLWQRLTSPCFELVSPEGFIVPEGWRFAFCSQIGYRDLVTLAECKWSKHLKLQVIKTSNDALRPDGKQVIFNPSASVVVKEFDLEY